MVPRWCGESSKRIHDRASHMMIDRQRAASLGRETVLILKRGHYVTDSGETVDLAHQVQRAVDGTRSYPPGCELPAITPRFPPAAVEVVNDTTLARAFQMVHEGRRPVALNFASATHPGGGFLNGARAQEESLARSSALYACLEGNDMYRLPQVHTDAMYTDYAIYSPNVPVFRSDDGTLLTSPYVCSFITCAAVHFHALQRYAPDRVGEVEPVMRKRIAKVLRVAALHGHESLILGAWGCGAFGNRGEDIADGFRQCARRSIQRRV